MSPNTALETTEDMNLGSFRQQKQKPKLVLGHKVVGEKKENDESGTNDYASDESQKNNKYDVPDNETQTYEESSRVTNQSDDIDNGKGTQISDVEYTEDLDELDDEDFQDEYQENEDQYQEEDEEEEEPINPFPLPAFSDMYCRTDDIAFGMSDLKPQSEPKRVPRQEPVQEPSFMERRPDSFKEISQEAKKPDPPKLTTNPEASVDEIQFMADQLKAERLASMSKREQRKYLKRKKKEEKQKQRELKKQQKREKRQKKKKPSGEKQYRVKEEYQSSEEDNYYSDVKPQDDGKVDAPSSPLGIFTKNWKLGILLVVPFIFGLVMLVAGIGHLIG